jgi:translation initiation factor 1
VLGLRPFKNAVAVRASPMKPKYTFRGVVMKTDPSRSRAAAKPSVKQSGPAVVRVGREVAGRAGKGVSVIHGLPVSATELEELATGLKRLCGAGGAVKEGVIEIQGDHRDRLVAELRKLGYDAKRSGG